MRRKNQEVKGAENIDAIINKCNVCRLALNDGDYPYIVPLNFGMDRYGGKLCLYFHCASEGKKLDLIRKNGHAGFEMDIPQGLLKGKNACDYSMAYKSVIGKGLIEILPEEEKIKALKIIMRHFCGESEFSFSDDSLKAVTTLKLTVSEITAKHYTAN